MICKNCGKEIREGAMFCLSCGTKIDAPVQPGTPVQNVPPVQPVQQMQAPNMQAPNVQNPYMQGQAQPRPVQQGPVQQGTVQQGPIQQGPVQQSPYMQNPNMQRNMGGSVMQPYPGMQPVQQAPKKKTGKIIAIVLGAVFGVILLFGVLIFALGSSGTKDQETSEAKAAKETEEEEEAKEEKKKSKDSPSKKAVGELVAILDETMATEETYADKIEAAEDIPAFLEVTGSWYSEVDEQYAKVKAIEGLPANVSKAANEGYESYLAAVDCMTRNLTFAQAILDLSETINTDDYVQTYYDFQEKHGSIVCPENMTDSYKALGNSLDILATYVNRSAEAEELDDTLRIYSALNLIMRFGLVFDNEVDKISNITMEEMDFVIKQSNAVWDIFNEIRTVSELSAEEIDAYEFEYKIDGVLTEPAYDHIENIYPSLYNTYDSFVTVKLGCLHGSRDVIIECEIPGLSQSMSQSYHIGGALTVLNIKPPAADGQLSLDTAKDTQIKVTIKDKADGSIIDTQSFPVHLYSRNDFLWYTDDFGTITQDNILCFLAPDSKAVAELKREAIDYLSDMTGGNMTALQGYQGPNYLMDYDGDGYADNETSAEFLTTYMQAAALMRAMSETGIRYTNDAFSIDQAGQHILFPDQVLERKTGLCIETSLVMASALQGMGMHTCLVFPPGHAQVAVETWDGSGYYFLIETTALPNAEDDFLDDANFFYHDFEGECDFMPITFLTPDEWAAYLSNDPDDDEDDCYVIDCSDGALLGLTPFAN